MNAVIFARAPAAIQGTAEQPTSALGRTSEKYHEEQMRNSGAGWAQRLQKESRTANPWRGGELAGRQVRSAKALENCLRQRLWEK